MIECIYIEKAGRHEGAGSDPPRSRRRTGSKGRAESSARKQNPRKQGTPPGRKSQTSSGDANARDVHRSIPRKGREAGWLKIERDGAEPPRGRV
jgi:hypothetical protein